MRHGGDLAWASDRYGIAEDGWLDLSTGINPRPWPGAAAMAVSQLQLAWLPDAAGLGRLLAAARAAYGVPTGSELAAAPGSEALVRLLPRLMSGPAALVATSYGSYAEAWRDAAHPLRPAETAAAAAQDPGSSVVLVNPNNPDGRTLPPGEILSIARSRCGGGLVVVDEAFADAEEGVSVVPHLTAGEPVLVLKSFGKLFGLPGLRLGFAIGPRPVVERVKADLGDWPVSSAALAIGSAALSDIAWQDGARRWLARQAARLDAVLRGAGLRIAGGTPLFRLAATPDATMLHEALAARGVWTRIWPGAAQLIRFGLPPGKAGLDRLGEALAAALRA